MGARKWLDWVRAAGQYHGYVACHVDDVEIRACPFVFCPYLIHIAVWCARLLVSAAHRLLIGGRITSSGTAAGQRLSGDGVVAISGDGTTVAAGSRSPSDVQVWKWDGSNYTPLGQPIAIPTEGSAVKLSTDGQTLAVAVDEAPGAIVGVQSCRPAYQSDCNPYEPERTTNRNDADGTRPWGAGAAFVYTWNGTAWDQKGLPIFGPPFPAAGFGRGSLPFA